MPCIAVAGSDSFNTRSTIIHRQVQRYQAVAACKVCFCVGGCVSAGGVGYAMPDVAVAGGDSFDSVVTIVDGQMECDGAVATDSVGRDIGG